MYPKMELNLSSLLKILVGRGLPVLGWKKLPMTIPVIRQQASMMGSQTANLEFFPGMGRKYLVD